MRFKRQLQKKINDKATEIECFDRYGYGIKGFLAYLKRKNKSKYKITVIRQNEEVDNEIKKIDGYRDVGIVVQGPIMKEDNFTLNTIKKIRNIYPDVKIVVSTWIGEIDVELRNLLEQLQCTIIESKSFPSEFKGENEKTGHLNNQIYSSRVGIEYLKDCEIKYVLKIRSDLRINKIDFIPYLCDLLKLYCNKEENTRLLNVAFSNSLCGIPFHLSDFIWFGKTEEMIKLYSVPFRSDEELKYIIDYVSDENKYNQYKENVEKAIKITEIMDEESESCKLDKKFLTRYHEESYLAYEYAKIKINISEKDDLFKLYCRFLKDYVIIIDDIDLLVYWNKSLYSIVQSDYSKKVYNRLTHSKWLKVYNER